jgi:hypothetical protein
VILSPIIALAMPHIPLGESASAFWRSAANHPSRQSRNAPAAVAESARGTAARAHQNPGSRRRSCHSVGDGRPTARLDTSQSRALAVRVKGQGSASHWVVLWCDRRPRVDRQAWRGSSFERGAFQLTPGWRWVTFLT